jgi:hypothetical protein
VKIRKHALGWLPWQLPPLLYRHNPAEVAGVIDELAYTDAGLRISCTVDHAVNCRFCSPTGIGIDRGM